MPSIKVRDLRDDLPFGAIIEGVDWDAVRDDETRRQINAIFEDRGMILFRGCESSAQFQVALSTVFGPLKDHPTRTVNRNDDGGVEGVIDNYYKPKDGDLGLVEIDGRKLAQWIPWHYDHCYNDELNRAGVLRMLIPAKDGGYTGFADGADLYRRLSPQLREAIEDKTIIYTLDVRYSHMKFIPRNVKSLGVDEYTMKIVRESASFPRALHPAVWTRNTGEKVLHISSWVAAGIEGMETEEGDALLRAVCDEIAANDGAYWHDWQVGDMVIWDNWRFLHAVSGANPQDERRITRTTIAGDYGLGRFEGGKKIGEVQREIAM
jgi:taurine dioxygenase